MFVKDHQMVLDQSIPLSKTNKDPRKCEGNRPPQTRHLEHPTNVARLTATIVLLLGHFLGRNVSLNRNTCEHVHPAREKQIAKGGVLGS